MRNGTWAVMVKYIGTSVNMEVKVGWLRNGSTLEEHYFPCPNEWSPVKLVGRAAEDKIRELWQWQRSEKGMRCDPWDDGTVYAFVRSVFKWYPGSGFDIHAKGGVQ